MTFAWGRTTWIAGSCALAGALWATILLEPLPVQAFVVTGDQLGLAQRHVRVFNNFTDAQANSNTTPDFSFPGSTGAALAIWKACVEWGSAKHLDGYGDPKQPGDLGSGGSNFDCAWQGLATSVGDTNDNVHSEISGNGGGVLAFCETPTSDGWRIRYYAGWTWIDNPFANVSQVGLADIQGVATHEYGHALGLGHANVPGATMFATVPLEMTNWRTIEADDQAGVQFIYGALDAAKPKILDTALGTGTQLTIFGQGFAAVGNEVWFTPLTPSMGAVLSVGGLASTAGGTQIQTSIPPQAGPGDILVKIPGSAHAALSNSFPFDPTRDPCFAPKPYGQGKVNSQGLTATLSWTGVPSATTNDFQIFLNSGVGGAQAVVFWGSAAHQTPFLGGTLLAQPPLQRVAVAALDPFGIGQFPIAVPPALIGQRRFLQVWYQDTADPQGVSLSNALEIEFCQ